MKTENRRTLCTNKQDRNREKTRKRAIAKALQLEGQSIWHIISIFWGFCSKILRFGKFCLATTNADHVAPRPFSTLNKQEIRTDVAVNLRCLLHTLWPWSLTLWPWTSVLAVTCWNYVLNLSEIDQCTPELLPFKDWPINLFETTCNFSD